MDFFYHGVFYECADHWESSLTADEHIRFVGMNECTGLARFSGAVG